MNIIYFEQIRTGFLEYHSEIKKLSKAEAVEVLENMWKKVYPKQTYVDFYYYRLSEEAKQKVEKLLTAEELSYLNQQKLLFAQKEAPVIFPMDEMLLAITTKLNEAEMLFSTIYFDGEIGKRSTWWGNYNQEYIVFTDKGDKE